MMPPAAPPAADPPGHSAVEVAATRAAALALALLVLWLLGYATTLVSLRVAATVALSVGLSAGLIVLLQRRPALCALWAELTSLIAAGYLAANVWNGLLASTPTWNTVLDLLLAALVWWRSWRLAVAARAANGGD